ncbi:MAG TPA: hypothetical protein VLT87_27995 [Thermoanaerobaculia bacterium]|nr:hypothetical protein [Thermoanaerobaculia bacterium]
MGIDGNWIISRLIVKGTTGMLLDRSLLSISGTEVKYIRSDQAIGTITLTNANSLDNKNANAGPYIYGNLATIADYEVLTGWISDTKDNESRTKMDAFVAVRSPFEGNWRLFSVVGNTTKVVENNSILEVTGRAVKFYTSPTQFETLNDVIIGADSMFKERTAGVKGHRLDAKVVRRGGLMFLLGTIGVGTDTKEYGPAGDTETDTFTAVKVSPAG